MSSKLSASVLARLLTLAKQRGDDYSCCSTVSAWSVCWLA